MSVSVRADNGSGGRKKEGEEEGEEGSKQEPVKGTRERKTKKEKVKEKTEGKQKVVTITVGHLITQCNSKQWLGRPTAYADV